MSAFSRIQSILIAAILILVGFSTAFAGKRNSAGNDEYSGGSFLAVGEEVFYRQWQSGDYEERRSGLGPLYNATSCIACHINNGRGRPLLNNLLDPSFVVRLSISPQNEEERMALALEEYATVAEPRYGRQLQDKSVSGSENGEGEIRVSYRDKLYSLDDGEVVILHRPVYSIAYLKFGEMSKYLQISPRIAQPLHGIGLLEAISNESILAGEDPRDKDKNGISGRANLVRNIETGEIVLGRFGWKATQPNLLQQTAAAFAQDIGISSSLFSQTGQGCSNDIGKCEVTGSKLVEGVKTEISDDELKLTAEYLSQFPVKYGRTARKPDVERVGENLFSEIGCISCHRKSYKINIKDADGKYQSQTIYPYSDLLLHDMGAALADHRPVAQASGWEWRTQPLWGIGKTEEVNGNKFFLHDGRARSITEAILWHGGEARKAREKYAALNKKQRTALIEFVEGL